MKWNFLFLCQVIYFITDIDGEYSIGISKADKKILQASYLGYETKQEWIGSRRVVNFFLKESSQALDK